MDYVSVKKLSSELNVDYYQLKSHIEWMGLKIEKIGKAVSVSYTDSKKVVKLVKTYSSVQISYMKSHNVTPFFEGTLLLDLRKKHRLNERQFKSKCTIFGLEFKNVYSKEECEKFNDFMEGTSKMNRAEQRELKYVSEGWIPLRKIFDELGAKYDFSENTGMKILEHLGIEIHKPSHQFAFLNKEDEEKFEEFLKGFESAKDRRLFFQEKTCMKKYGVPNPTLSKGAREKISEKVKASCTEERQSKIEATKLKKYGKRSITDSEKSMESRIKRYGSATVNHKYEYDGLEFHSSWEVYYYIYQKEILGNSIKRGKIFEYAYDGKTHRYECDFIVNGKNIEIKGNQYLDENNDLLFPYTKQKKIDFIEKQRLWDAKQKCMEKNKVEVISKKEIEEMMKIVDEKYTSDYVPLFRTDLEFPYPSLGKKSDYDVIRHFHKSIYNARREKMLSPFEAWKDKNLIKKCALNRLKYVGSCKPSDILQGFNVAKIAPKVSVFNPKLAEELIKKHLSDVETIIDPFSGFSGRMIGAWRSGKKYIGYDINEWHVAESNLLIGYFGMKDCSVLEKNLLEFNETTYNGSCALFTCPPYLDKEIWNENETVKSCDEWIDVCMEKHKCFKYLFVVDETEKYKDCIMETIENKSHFGSNKEFVVLIERGNCTTLK